MRGSNLIRWLIAPVVLLVLFILGAGCGFFEDPDPGTGPACEQGGCNIGGYVYDFQGKPMEGVRIVRTGAINTWVTTNAQGYYVVPGNVIGWNYCLAAKDSGWVFEPEKRCYTVEGNYGDQNFVGTPSPIREYFISGRVVDGGGNPVKDVLITIQCSSQTPVHTGANGNYLVEHIIGVGDYCVVPSKAGCGFQPTQRCFENLDTNRAGQDFVAVCQ